MSNPFVKKSEECKARQRQRAEHNFKELQKVFFSFKPGDSDDARERVRERLSKADEARKHYE